MCDSEWECPTSIRLQLSHSRGPPFHPGSGQTQGYPSSEHSRTSCSEAGVLLPNVCRDPRVGELFFGPLGGGRVGGAAVSAASPQAQGKRGREAGAPPSGSTAFPGHPQPAGTPLPSPLMSSGPPPGPRGAQEGCWEAGWGPEISGREARERVPVTPPRLSPPPHPHPGPGPGQRAPSPPPLPALGGPLPHLQSRAVVFLSCCPRSCQTTKEHPPGPRLPSLASRPSRGTNSYRGTKAFHPCPGPEFTQILTQQTSRELFESRLGAQMGWRGS